MVPDQEFDNIDPESVAASGLPNFIPPQMQNARAADTVVTDTPEVAASEDAVVPADAPKADAAEPVVATDDPSVPVASGSADTGEVQKTPERSHAGVLVEHGSATYKNIPDEKKSYFVTIDTPAGPETIWGVDLERAINESGTNIGEPIKLDYMGSELVTVDKLVRDDAGKVVGKEEIQTNRNTWEVHGIDHAELDRIASTSVQPGAEENGVKAVDPEALAFKSDAGVEEALKVAEDADQVVDPGVVDSADAPARGDRDQKAHEALMEVASRVKPRAGAVNAADLAMVNAAFQPEQPQVASVPGAGPTRGQEQVRTGAEALIEGGASLLGGAAALTGTMLKGMGKGAAGLAAAIGGRAEKGGADAEFTGVEPLEHDAAAALDAPASESPISDMPVADAPVTTGEAAEVDQSRVTVLPRLSEYRVEQVDRAASNYEKAHETFWQSDRMSLIRQEIEARAEATGLSVQDIMEKMKPNGEYAELHEKFNEAVAQSPEAQTAKKAMDKALEGWTRQYGRAQEELLNPETEGNPHYEKLKDRLGKSSDRMHKNASDVPAFEGEQSHMEKLKEAMQKLVERLKEMAQSFVSFVRGKSSGKAAEAGGADNAPAP